ncbi:MAG: UDP-N-acetylmuramoyl-L-alanyl-D-glutamate--2,6-diaminopimelate ligase [Bauldia sp.]
MLLGDLLRDSIPAGAPAVEVVGITADSRAVRPGLLFAALRGAKADGAAFAAAAIAAGAAAILAPTDFALDDPGIPVVRVDDPRRALALAAARFYPRQPRHLVAVTGTSGKTSVAVFTRQIFEAAGFPAASVGTIGVVAPGRIEPGGLTTPDPVKLHRTLDELAAAGVDHAAIEASSHGLDQHRLDGLRLAAAGFTNLGRDHLDYHPDVEDYFRAKLRLFSEILPEGGTAVVNADSEYAPRVIGAVRRGARTMTVGEAGEDIRILSARPDGLAQVLALEVFGSRAEIRLPLAGTFQAANAAMAAGLAIAAGIDPATAIAALEKLEGAPGRLDKVGETPDGAAVFVDYAHKPEAIRAALAALRPMTSGRLIVVFGAGGDRDPGKRPLMGAAAAETADIVIVTDDNPRSEEPAAIRRAILAGAPGAIEIAGRAAAIDAAVAMLRHGDVLCVAGKGHETGQTIGDMIFPFSDHEVVREALGRVRA